VSSVEQAGAPLPEGVQQQFSLAGAVAAGELWMEAGVAESAAQRCGQAFDEIEELVIDAHELLRKCAFGDNGDGNTAADRFVDAGHDYIKTMRNAQHVFVNMAATYRAAGRMIDETDAASEQMFRGRSK
jgi:uncharacterized protein YukE